MNYHRNMATGFWNGDISHGFFSVMRALNHQAAAAGDYLAGYSGYLKDFWSSYLLSTKYFSKAEMSKLPGAFPVEDLRSYAGLMRFNAELSTRALISGMDASRDVWRKEMDNGISALTNTFFPTEDNGKDADLAAYFKRQAVIADAIARGYPNAIQEIESEYGFGFERGQNKRIAETDRFILYQILPTDREVSVRYNGKPILILPPYVLGANILGFLPGENRSYAHCFANQGIPTYIRIMKDIAETPAVQVVTGEEDTLDTRFFCEIIKNLHGRPVTLNGYCQGGFMAVCGLLTGELDGLVDALVTCVSPMDGTRSRGFNEFFGDLPDRFNDLMYGTKTLPNGNEVGDGALMGWVYKLKSIEMEFPPVAFFRDLSMFRSVDGKPPKISKAAAAINYWLKNERCDLPLAVTRMSFASFNTPVTEDGTLPIRLFGKKLNFKRIQEKKIPWLICYGEKDDLVEKETALAPLDFIDAEVAAFPKGHVAIATSWSNPESACALHTCFGAHSYRGPVRYHLDLDLILSKTGPS